jgi:heme A synthase
MPSFASIGPVSRIARFAWGVLAYDVAVVAWGAYVRASGSGAGCGQHWPLCNGEIVPRSPRVETIIELSHRVTSGLSLALTVALFVWALRAYPRGHLVRRAAGLTTLLMVLEALLGAGLVLFALVAKNQSLTRAFSVSLHLVNTFLLLASTAVTAWWASGGAPLRLARVRGQPAVAVGIGVPLATMFLVGASGAVTALGDTLFPPTSLASGLAQDFAPGAHLFVRLRALHPMFALTAAAAIVVGTGIVRALRPARSVRRLSYLAVVLVVAQVALGLLNVAMLAPVWMQLAHLALADAVWITLVLTAAAALGEEGPASVAVTSAGDKPAARMA